jgi:hypothetical protein
MIQITLDDYLRTARFEGPANGRDIDRLCLQLRRIYDLMCDGQWRSLAEIEAETGDPQASISAQLRNLRKMRFGAHDVQKRRRGESCTWEYCLMKPFNDQAMMPEQKGKENDFLD